MSCLLSGASQEELGGRGGRGKETTEEGLLPLLENIGGGGHTASEVHREEYCSGLRLY